MRQIFRPAIAVLNRLSYPRKFALISLLFVLPLALVMTLLIGQIDQRIEFGQHELYGTAYLRPLRVLDEQLLAQRRLAHTFLSGKRSLAQQLRESQAGIDQSIAALDEAERRYGHVLQTATRQAALKQQWQRLRAEQLQLDPAASAARHTELVAAVRELMLHVGDTSNLILDPDLDSYYLMDAVLLKLPEGQELLAELLFESGQVVTVETLSDATRAEMTIDVGLIETNRQATERGLGIAFANNPSQTIQPVLEQPLRESLAATSVFLEAVALEVLDRQDAQTYTYSPSGEAALAASFALWDRTVVELDGLLQTRIDGYARQKSLVIAFAVAILLLVLYLLVAFYLSVMQTVAGLEVAARRLAGGTTTELVDLHSRDELAQVARSFNRVATALVTASAQRQAVFDNAIDGLITLDQQGRIVALNPAAERMFGYVRADLVDQPATQLLPDYTPPDERGAIRREVVARRSAGDTFPAELALSTMPVGEQRLVLGIVRDISERKQAEAERGRLQEAIIHAQAAALEELATPLIPVGERTIVLPLIGAVDARRSEQVQAALLRGIERHQARVAILDITGVPEVSADFAQTIVQAAAAARLLGAQIVLTGIRPGAAQALVTLDADLGTIVTHSTLQRGIAHALT